MSPNPGIYGGMFGGGGRGSVECGWNSDPRSLEEKMSEERQKRRKIARGIISEMDDVKKATEEDMAAFEKNRIDNTEDVTNGAKILIEKRVDKGEEILNQIEKEGGIEGVKNTIEILKQVTDSSEKQIKTNESHEAVDALNNVIADANENINIREAFLKYYKKLDAE